MLKEGLSTGRLRAVQRAADAVVGAEFVFLCVETPQSEDGSADLSSVTAAAAEIAPHLADGAIIVNKSTVPGGHRRARRAGRRARRRRGRLEPRVPPRGHRRRGLAQPRPRRRRSRRPRGRGAGRRAVQRLGRAGGHHRRDDVRAHQVRLERVPRDQAHVHQHDGRAVRGRRGERARPRHRHRVRQAHRVRVPAAGSRVGWLVPPEGHRGARRDLQLRGLRRLDRPRCDHGQRGPDAPRRGEGRRRSGRRRSTARPIAAFGLSFKANTGDRRGSPAISITRMLVEEGATVRAFDPTITSEDADQDDLSHLTRLRLGLRGGRGRARHRAAHRVGGVPLARLHEDPLARRDARRSSTRGTSSTAASCTGSASRTRASAGREGRRRRRCGLLRLAPLRRAARTRRRGGRPRQPVHRDRWATSRPRSGTRRSRSSSSTSRECVGRRRRGRRRHEPRVPCVAAGVPLDAPRDARRSAPRARGGCSSSRRRSTAQVRPGILERGLRRPGRAPAARGLLGQRQPRSGRAASTTSRSASARP